MLDPRDILRILLQVQYDHARRLHLEKQLLDPGDGRRFQKRNGRYVAVSEVKRLHIYTVTETSAHSGVAVM